MIAVNLVEELFKSFLVVNSLFWMIRTNFNPIRNNNRHPVRLRTHIQRAAKTGKLEKVEKPW